MRVFFLTFCLLLTSVLCKSQDLVFSRVIDTVLVVQTVPGQYTGVIFEGTSISPEPGKVWKIESMAIPRRLLTERPYNVNNVSEYLNGTPYLKITCLVDDGVNAVQLIESQFDNSNLNDPNFNMSPFAQVSLYAAETRTISFPFWINQYSSLYPVIYQAAYNGPQWGLYEPQTAFVYLSMIEFSVD